MTLTMPTADGNSGRYTVKKVSPGILTIEAQPGELIEGESSITISFENNSVDLISDDTNWNII